MVSPTMKPVIATQLPIQCRHMSEIIRKRTHEVHSLSLRYIEVMVISPVAIMVFAI